MFNPLNLLKKTTKAPENFVALDFGTTSTKAFIFSLDEQAQLLGQGKGTPAEAVEQAATGAGFRPEQAVVGIGGENVWCLTTTVRLNRPNPETEINPKEVEKLNEQVFRTALMQVTPQMSQFLGDPELNLQLIDSQTLYYKLDGQIYPPTPARPPASSLAGEVGREGKVLECSIFTAYSPAAYLSQLSETLKPLELNLWAVSSLMSVFVKTLAGSNPLDYNAIVMDIGGKVTDVAVVFGGGIWGTRALSLGGECFTTALIKRLAFDDEEAEAKKVAYANHQLRDEEVPNIKEALKPALELWLAGIETTLADFEGIKTFPNKIILTGGGARLEDVREKLSTYPLTRTLAFASPPVVEVRADIGPQDMRLIAKDIKGESNA